MSGSILGIGLALPEHRASQASALDLARRLWNYSEDRTRALDALYRRTGVKTRHTVLDVMTGSPLRPAGANCALVPTTAERMASFEQHAPPLAQRACSVALERSATAATSITHLVTVSCTGIGAPGIDLALVDRLGLRGDVARTHVGFMGCYGALAGLRVAAAFACQPDARVLLSATEICSLHFHYGDDPERIVANALFADGSGAAVISPAHRGVHILGNGSFLFPDSRDAMAWKIGDRGFEMSLSPRIPDLIRGGLRGWLDEWLHRYETRLSDIRHFVIHPGGPRILHAVEEALGITSDATQLSHAVLAEHGNMSSPTVLFILERMLIAGARGKVLALGFGPGLVAEAALLEV